MRQEIDVYQYMNDILRNLKMGVLVTAKDGDKVNSMTISWGQIGIEWNKLIFTTYIRPNRFTHPMIEKTGEFTVNIPMDADAKKILAFCGSRSGRDCNKADELGLTLAEGYKVNAPGIKELPLTLECKLIYSQEQQLSAVPEAARKQFYPNDSKGAEPKPHTMFYGEIVSAYIAD